MSGAYEWRVFACSHCDLLEGVVVARVVAHAAMDVSAGVDYCPGCGSYLSLCSVGAVEVTGDAMRSAMLGRV